MSSIRITASPEGSACYHVMSRTVSDDNGGLMLFGAEEKNVFARQLRRHAGFAGIEVLTWCMMDNHFHLLIRVPERSAFLDKVLAAGRKQFWNQLRCLYCGEQVAHLRRAVENFEAEASGGGSRDVQAIIERYTDRMADLSRFVQGLKHAFSTWYNRKHGREGTLWMRRFKSVLLEGEGWVLQKVAAYIDLNPVRADLVRDPGHYRWSGFGQAVEGGIEARRGLSKIYGYQRNAWSRMGRVYRDLLSSEGPGPSGPLEDTRRRRADDGDVPSSGALMPIAGPGSGKQLADRVRYFADGVAIGSREFIESVFQSHQLLFGSKRKTGARKFRGEHWRGAGFFSLRDLDAGKS